MSYEVYAIDKSIIYKNNYCDRILFDNIDNNDNNDNNNDIVNGIDNDIGIMINNLENKKRILQFWLLIPQMIPITALTIYFLWLGRKLMMHRDD